MNNWRNRQLGSTLPMMFLVPFFGFWVVVGLIYLTHGWIVIAYLVAVLMLLAVTMIRDFLTTK